MVDDRPNEPIRVSARPLNREVAIESEPVRVLDSARCSPNAEDEPRDPDRDRTKPFASDPAKLRDTARDLCRLT